MKGYFYSISARSVAGWAMDGDSGPVDLVAKVNGKTVAEFKTSLHRPDLHFLPRQDLGFEFVLSHALRRGDELIVMSKDGHHVEGSPAVLTDVEESRVDKALALITKDMKILEIGPSFNPIAPRRLGWNSNILDHATQDELREKYRNAQPIERIEPVDFVWLGGPIESAVPLELHGTFDAVIASHVIEHIPDPIGFYLSAAKLLKSDGIVSLIVPDKRVMFDFFKPLSTTADFLEAHFYGRTRHSKRTTFLNAAYNVKSGADIAWHPKLNRDFSFWASPLEAAYSSFMQTPDDDSGHYVDEHHTVYTPSSFALIILELSHLGLISFEIEVSYPPAVSEFYVTLRKKAVRGTLSSQELDAERMRLLKATIHEQARQANWMLDDWALK